MNEVLIPELIYPCWAYALRRIGKGKVLSLDWVKNTMPDLLNPCGDDAYGFDKGTILVWEHERGRPDIEPVKMLKSGNILWLPIEYNYHAGVYEGDGVVSDCAEHPGDFILPFIFRNRIIGDWRKPDYWIDPEDI